MSLGPFPRQEERFRIALFPLPVVLLPGARMPLHIFEPRYRDMVRDALATDRRFGMMYHDWDRHGPFLGEEGRVGTVAEIIQYQMLEDGRSMILIDGRERFHIVDGIESETLYFEALVSPYPDATAMEGEELAFRRGESIELFHRVLASLAERPSGVPEPNRGEELSFLLAQTIAVEPGFLQRLLELTDEGSRLERIDRIFRAALD
jgi:ATP-dependent Lon protease